MKKTMSTTNRFAFFAATAILALTTGVGCGVTQQTAVASPKVETVQLADGVELKVSEEAGPEARRVVEQIRSEMRSRYLGAR